MRIGYAGMDWSTSLRDDHNALVPGGACWYRMMLPAMEAEAHGHETCVGTLVFHRESQTFGVRSYLEPDSETAEGGFDVIVIQRQMNQDLEEGIRRARAAGQVVIQDIDDDLLNLDRRNQATHTVNASETINLRHYAKSLAASSQIICSTPYLERVYARFAPTVTVRNSVDVDRWPVRPDSPELVLGWVGAMPWRSGDLEAVAGWFGPFLQQYGGAWHHSGVTTVDKAEAWIRLKIPETVPHTWLMMAPIEEYPRLFDPITLGVVPLSTSRFNLAKSAIKGMEYAACGLPFLASDSPEYRWLETELDEEFVVRKPKHWPAALRRYVTEDARMDAGGRLRKAVVEHCSIADRWPEWEAAYLAASA